MTNSEPKYIVTLYSVNNCSSCIVDELNQLFKKNICMHNSNSGIYYSDNLYIIIEKINDCVKNDIEFTHFNIKMPMIEVQNFLIFCIELTNVTIDDISANKSQKYTYNISEEHNELVQKLSKINVLSSCSIDDINVSMFQYKIYSKITNNIIYSPYQFNLNVNKVDLDEFQQGNNHSLLKIFGCHFRIMHKVHGYQFIVWAPHAHSVYLVGDFNEWKYSVRMNKYDKYGIWYIFIPEIIQEGSTYLYRVADKNNTMIYKIDPCALEFEVPPQHNCIINNYNPYSINYCAYDWQDQDYMNETYNKNRLDQCIIIYEINLCSWKKNSDNSCKNYRHIADDLITYCHKFKFTHVEFMPLAHHPYDGSWGYQVSGFFAVYSKLGSCNDLKYLIDKLHQANIGVILDFTIAHFVKDQWGLSYYDGTPTYEYTNQHESEHKGWGTLAFNYRRTEVVSFLMSIICYWVEFFHLDGIRFDAISAIIYKNYCRKIYVPNEYGGIENIEGIEFLKKLNRLLDKKFPYLYRIAEESTSFGGVTDKSNLCFDYKWDLGWMNDTLEYLCKPPVQRSKYHNKLTFRNMYYSTEKWILPLSHDEVVNGKGSILDKCGFINTPFDEKLNVLKVLLTYQCTIPGCPLIFMGVEFAQGREWNWANELDWHEANEPARSRFTLYVQDLYSTYRMHRELYAGDHDTVNFQWCDCDNKDGGLLAYYRKYNNVDEILIVCNFSQQYHENYLLGANKQNWVFLLNSDDWKYGGAMRSFGSGVQINGVVHGVYGWLYSLRLNIPPCSALILKSNTIE